MNADEIADKVIHDWLIENPSQSLLGVGIFQQAIAQSLRAAFERAAELTCVGCADLAVFTPAEWSEENDRFIHKRVSEKSRIWCDASDIRVEMK